MKRHDGFVGDVERYVFDAKKCTTANGWAQLDTRQDASYFGNWVNPFEFKMFTYCEGDTTLIECDNASEFVEHVNEICKWYEKRDNRKPGIDPGFDPKLKAEFEKLNLAHWLH